MVEAGAVEPRVTMTKMRADVRFVLVVLYYCYPQISKNSEDKKITLKRKSHKLKRLPYFCKSNNFFV